MVVILDSPIICRFESTKSLSFQLGKMIAAVSVEEEDAFQALDNKYNTKLAKLKKKFDMKMEFV